MDRTDGWLEKSMIGKAPRTVGVCVRVMRECGEAAGVGQQQSNKNKRAWGGWLGLLAKNEWARQKKGCSEGPSERTDGTERETALKIKKKQKLASSDKLRWEATGMGGVKGAK